MYHLHFDGKNHGPYLLEQIKSMWAAGIITADAMYWTEGGFDWKPITELIYPVSALPLPQKSPNGMVGGLELEVDVAPLFGRILLVAICRYLILPSPWVTTNFYKWVVDHLRLPNGASLSFKGKPKDIWYVFMLGGLCCYAGLIHPYLPYLIIPITAFLMLLIMRWFVSNLTLDGQVYPLKFTGSYLAYLGWSVLCLLSIFTIIGWPWVGTAFMRWQCSHIEGTRKRIIFTASGFEYLWRGVVFVLCSIFIIPIPWAFHWFIKWFISKFSLEKRIPLVDEGIGGGLSRPAQSEVVVNSRPKARFGLVAGDLVTILLVMLLIAGILIFVENGNREKIKGLERSMAAEVAAINQKSKLITNTTPQPVISASPLPVRNHSGAQPPSEPTQDAQLKAAREESLRNAFRDYPDLCVKDSLMWKTANRLAMDALNDPKNLNHDYVNREHGPELIAYLAAQELGIPKHVLIDANGKKSPAPGYIWANPSDKGDYSVIPEKK